MKFTDIRAAPPARNTGREPAVSQSRLSDRRTGVNGPWRGENQMRPNRSCDILLEPATCRRGARLTSLVARVGVDTPNDLTFTVVASRIRRDRDWRTDLSIARRALGNGCLPNVKANLVKEKLRNVCRFRFAFCVIWDWETYSIGF